MIFNLINKKPFVVINSSLQLSLSQTCKTSLHYDFKESLLIFKINSAHLKLGIIFTYCFEIYLFYFEIINYYVKIKISVLYTIVIYYFKYNSIQYYFKNRSYYVTKLGKFVIIYKARMS